MNELTCRERLLKTINGEQIDRLATFDNIHNIDLIEYLTGEKINPKNAEDLWCKGVSKILDLVRHFTFPDMPETRTMTDFNGFVYHFEWWTGHLAHRPKFNSTREIADSIERDIEQIYKDIEANKVSHISRQHAMLFDERYETIEELKADYKRLYHKLEDTQLLPPEDCNGIAIAAERYDETGWWYIYYDYPEVAKRYLDALNDYQLHFIDQFADSSLCPVAQISIATGTGTGLLYSEDIVVEEILPREKLKIDRWKKHGYKVFCFLDGYKWPVIDYYLDLGVDEIHPIESYCKMDVKTMREIYPELVISQPVDCQNLLAFGTPEEVRMATLQAIEDAGAYKIIIGSTSEIHPLVKVENAMSMYDTARNYKLN